MRDAGRLLGVLAVFCGFAFVGFAVASVLLPSERGPLQASATAFLVGAAVSWAAGRSHAETVRRLERLERGGTGQKHAEPLYGHIRMNKGSDSRRVSGDDVAS